MSTGERANPMLKEVVDEVECTVWVPPHTQKNLFTVLDEGRSGRGKKSSQTENKKLGPLLSKVIF